VPYLHPGPFGTVGGGDLPVRLQHALAAPTLVLHGTCTHDFNPVSSRECDRLALKVKGMLRGLDWGGATRSVRVQVGDVKVLGQRFGATALLVGTLAPECTEDVELGVGLAAMEAARGAGLPNIVLADAHNTTTPTPNLVLRGNPESYDYIEACRRAARELAKLRPQKAKLGVATRRPYLNPAQGVGGLGLTVMVVEAGRQRTAYVGIDANNIVGGLRERILAALPDMDHAEVVTSDSHEGNTLTKTNFVGERLDAEVLIRDVRALCDAAVTSLEPVEWGGAVSLARGLRVVGAQRSSKLAGIVAAMKHLLWGLILAVGLACAAVSAVLFALL